MVKDRTVDDWFQENLAKHPKDKEYKTKDYPRKLPPTRVARKLRSSFEDDGKYYHCQNCGFVCSIDRDELSGSNDKNGLSYENYSVAVYESPQGNGPAILNGVIEHFQTVLEVGSDGEPKVVEEHWRAISNSGCPLCGSRNWRGDY